MCLVAIAIDQSRRFPLVVASNRDEFFTRSTARLAWWNPRPGDPDVLAGRDLESGGTWMGLTAKGRLALLTNVRGVVPQDAGAPSRGHIVTDWLSGRESTSNFWARTALSGYNGFNLIAADFLHGECIFASNVDAAPKRLEAGVYGLSNGHLNAPWPKVTALKANLLEAMGTASSAEDLATRLFAALGDRTIAADAELPHTGVGLERERQLSAAFIRMPESGYGTRCSTLVITERVGRHLITHVMERTFNASGTVALLRQSTLRNWPPRYTEGTAQAVAEQSLVSESKALPSSDHAEPIQVSDSNPGEPAAKRTRARSLLKPASDHRRKKGATPTLQTPAMTTPTSK
jgi:uncharacterized protein with NRDE domain